MNDFSFNDLDDCLKHLNDVTNPYFSNEEGVRRFASGILKLNTDAVSQFAQKWLQKLKDCVEQDNCVESELMNFMNIANCVIITNNHDSVYKSAFQKVLKPAIIALEPKLFARKKSLYKFFTFWKHSSPPVFSLGLIDHFISLLHLTSEVSGDQEVDMYDISEAQRTQAMRRSSNGALQPVQTRLSACDSLIRLKRVEEESINI